MDEGGGAPAPGPWIGSMTRFDGRTGPLTLTITLVTMCALWRLGIDWASEEINGSVTLAWTLTGVGMLTCAAAVSMRIHDMGEGRRTATMTVATVAWIIFCIAQTPQAGAWPDVGGIGGVAVTGVLLLRKGVRDETPHGPPPGLTGWSFRTSGRSAGNLIGILCWMTAWLGLGVFIELEMHQYRKGVEQRVANGA